MNKMTWKKGMRAAGAIMLAVGVFFGSKGSIVTAFASNTGNQSGQAASSNAYLKSLNVTPGTMSPEFSPEITEYTVNIDEDVISVSVTCSVASSSAKVVQAGGFKDLQIGSNEGKLTVQAEDGTQCTYILHIIRGGTSTAPAASNSAGQTGQSTGSSVTSAGAAVWEGNHGRPSGTVAGSVSTPGNAAAGVPGDDTESEGESTADPTEGEGEEPEGTDPAEGVDPEAAPEEGVSAVTSTDLIPVGGDTIYAPFYVHPTFPEELLPQDFVRQDYNYKGTTVSSAYFPLGNIRLLYLSAIDGSSAAFRIYYEDEDTFMDFVQFKGTDGKFIMPVRNMGKIKIPDNYTGSYLPWTDTVVSCFVYTELTDKPITYHTDEDKDEQSDEDEEPVRVEDLDVEVEFFLIYAMNQNGEESFYLYDIKEDTYQRYVERDTSYELDQSYFKYKDIAHQRFAIMCALIFLLVIALFAIFNLWMKNRELKAELEEEDEDDEEVPRKPAVKKEAKKEVKKKEEPVKEAPSKETTEKTRTEAKPAVKSAMKPIAKAEVKPEQTPEQKPAAEPVKEAVEAPVKKKEEKSAGLKMINLSRESGSSGIDDDFEFEFINLDDE